MSVKTHMLKDWEGKPVDADKEADPDSREAKFAKLMTDEYDNLGKYFPEFARLKELLKLQALSHIVQVTYKNRLEESAKLNIPSEEIEEFIRDIRTQIYIILGKTFNDTIDNFTKQNGYSPSSTERTQSWNTFWNLTYENNVQSCLNIFSKKYHASGINKLVRRWLIDGNSADLVSALKDAAETHSRNKMRLICEAFKKCGFAAQLNQDHKKGDFTWVPAAFKRTDNEDKMIRVYGGIHMSSQFTPM